MKALEISNDTFKLIKTYINREPILEFMHDTYHT